MIFMFFMKLLKQPPGDISHGHLRIKIKIQSLKLLYFKILTYTIQNVCLKEQFWSATFARNETGAFHENEGYLELTLSHTISYIFRHYWAIQYSKKSRDSSSMFFIIFSKLYVIETMNYNIIQIWSLSQLCFKRLLILCSIPVIIVLKYNVVQCHFDFRRRHALLFSNAIVLGQCLPLVIQQSYAEHIIF